MQTDALFALIGREELYERPISQRHRWIFYVGHLEAFDWNQIARYELSEPPFHPAFDQLFEFGIDPGPGRLPSDQPADWPSIDDVSLYCRTSRAKIDNLLSRASAERIEIAIEHRLMHAETLTYMLHQMPRERPVERPQSGSTPPSQFVDIPAGGTTLGRRRGDGFGWDNEFEAHTVEVPAFAVERYKVTNGQWLEFFRDGGPPAPFWVERHGAWHVRGMFVDYPLPLDWPVYVSQQQAAAYARWRGADLPTEAELDRIAPTRIEGNFDFKRWDPVAVDATPGGDNAFGIAQLAGNGWEWTSTIFAPFPGFRPTRGYEGYSANFFDGEHYVMKGGSPRTAARLMRRSFRNWFRPDYPYIYASFRCVQR
jgi:formylglycine-generating enzyme required for sulfatase activity